MYVSVCQSADKSWGSQFFSVRSPLRGPRLSLSFTRPSSLSSSQCSSVWSPDDATGQKRSWSCARPALWTYWDEMRAGTTMIDTELLGADPVVGHLARMPALSRIGWRMSIDFADVGQRYTRYTRVPVAEYSIEQGNSQWRIVFIRRICITVFQERLYILSTL